MIPASQFFKGASSSALELTEAELATAEAVRVRGAVRGTFPSGRLYAARMFYVFTFTGAGKCALALETALPLSHVGTF